VARLAVRSRGVAGADGDRDGAAVGRAATRGGAAVKRPLALYAVAAYAFLHVPLLVLAVFSFNASKFTVWQGFSLAWYRAAIGDRELTESAINSLIIAAVATALATAIGTLAAYGLWKRSSAWLSGSM